VRETAPSEVMSPAAARVSVVVSALSVTGPAAVVVRPAFTAIVSLVSVMPPAALVLTAPLSVVVPVPSVWLREAVVSALAVTSSAETMDRAPRRCRRRPRR
jgi:hypothetical protein